jgi:hypothetical protein
MMTAWPRHLVPACRQPVAERFAENIPMAGNAPAVASAWALFLWAGRGLDAARLGLAHGRAVYRQHCNATAGHQLARVDCFLTKQQHLPPPYPCASRPGWHTCGCSACTARFHCTRPTMRTWLPGVSG